MLADIFKSINDDIINIKNLINDSWKHLGAGHITFQIIGFPVWSCGFLHPTMSFSESCQTVKHVLCVYQVKVIIRQGVGLHFSIHYSEHLVDVESEVDF